MKYWILTFSALALCAAARAQEIGGLMMNRDIMMPADMYELSVEQPTFGTARSIALAGAITSLGGDITSMAVNPAGLGMFRSNDVSITPMMLFNRSETDAAPYGKNSRNRFTLGSIGLVCNAYEGSGALVSLNVGLGYNRLADFNYRYSMQRTNQLGDIADVFSQQLTWGGVSSGSFYDGQGRWNWDNIDPQFWPAALGYGAYMTSQTSDSPVVWEPTWIGSDPDIGHYGSVESRGNMGEYVLSVGANIANKLYIGATLGIRSIHQEKNFYYNEDYLYASASGAADHGYGTADVDYQMLYAKFNQSVILDGSGVNFKLGITYRPTENLRIGLAVHTPTFYSLERRYQGAVATMSYVNRATDTSVDAAAGDYVPIDGITPVWTDSGPYRWEYISPTRLLTGISYTFGSHGLISVDYERDWYNGIRIRNNPSGLDDNFYDDTFRNEFKGSNTLRVGVEAKPHPRVSLRAGFGYSGSMLRNEATFHYSTPTTRRMLWYTAGLGVAITPRVTLDVAYQYLTAEQTAYYLFYAWDDVSAVTSSLYKTDLNRHSAALTLSCRF